jgi:hypothetical protein
MFRSLFRKIVLPALAWETMSVLPGWSYQQNKVTGQRRAIRCLALQSEPLEADWLYKGAEVIWVDIYQQILNSPPGRTIVVYGPMPNDN